MVFSCTPPEKGGMVRSGGVRPQGKLVRILLKKTAGKTVIQSTSNIIITNADTAQVYFKGKKAEFSKQNVLSVLKVDSDNKIINFNGRSYRGYLIVRKKAGYIYFINVLSMEEYLCGVVPAEMSKTWPLEALKAQAVAARSYVYNHMMTNKNDLYDVDGTTSFQVYKGYSVESENSNRAVFSTAGEILVYAGKPVMAFFHSTCGGHTVDNSLVWKGKDIPYLESTKCDFCKDSPHFNWQENLMISEISAAINKKYSIGRIKGLRFKKKTGRIYEADIIHSGGVLTITGNELRLLLGARKIKSLNFQTTKKDNVLSVKGHGYGHGVGMCQYGARGMANAGYSYVKILRKYYKGAEIKKRI